MEFGGIVGVLGSNGEVESCYNAGEASSRGTNTANLGGIVGRNYGTVKFVYNRGNVTSINTTKATVGGITGTNKGTLINCYNAGIITGNGVNPSGDIVGGAPSYITSNNTGSCTGCENIGVAMKEWTLTQINTKLNNNFVKDTANVNEGYPILKWQE